MQGFTKYIIRKGNHFCRFGWVPVPVFGKALAFQVIFDDTANYETAIPVNQWDINKLFGFTEGFRIHHDSCRIGWAFVDGALRLYGYSYSDGIREAKEITTVPLGRSINCKISLVGKSYMVQVNDAFVYLKRSKTSHFFFGFRLRPYFGGDEVAPHEITLFIKRLKQAFCLF